MAPLATTCSICRRRLDLSGKDGHRSIGALEDGQTLCRDCAWNSDREPDEERDSSVRNAR